jgi:opacity protein-like surface antigen
MKKLFCIGAAALAMTMSTAATAQAVGDWVLGQWRGGSDWYPGVVTARTGNQVTVRYDDGASETRPVNQVRAYNWRVGSRVVCRFTDGNWYDATITAMDPGGLTISVRYADGDTQITNTGRCRSE